MVILETIAVAFSMFSAVPMPSFPWNEKNLRYAMCAFPLVGAAVGLAGWFVWTLCIRLGVPAVLRGVLMTALPVWITGGVHMDGYSDTCDALSSHASREKKLEILKDPHVGSFAVIRIVLYLMLSAALWGSLPFFRPAEIISCFMLSRTLSGLAVASFPLAKDTGLAHTFASSSDRKRVKYILGAAAAVLTVLMGCAALMAFPGLRGMDTGTGSIVPPGIRSALPGMAEAAAAWAAFAWYYLVSRKEFGGITGDLAGWFLQKAELWMLAALAAGEYLAGRM